MLFRSRVSHAWPVTAILFLNASSVLASVAAPIPDPAPNPYVYLGSGDASVTYSGVMFSQSGALAPDANFFNVGSLFSGFPAVVASTLPSPSGIANILITLPVFTTDISLSYSTFLGSSVNFQLSNGDSFTETSAASYYATNSNFRMTDTLFDSVLVTTTDYVLSVNDVAYGPMSATPEPAYLRTLCGFIGGLGFVALWHRKERSQPAK